MEPEAIGKVPQNKEQRAGATQNIPVSGFVWSLRIFGLLALLAGIAPSESNLKRPVISLRIEVL